MSIEKRIKELGITIPEAAAPVGAYVPGTICGGCVFTSGQLCSSNGDVIKGRLGEMMTVEQGQEAARLSAINCLAIAKQQLGSLDKIKRVVKLTCFVNSTADFTDQPKVANGASFLMQDIFGTSGQHVRSAVGVSSLPMGAACEVEMVFEIAE